jgi:hypothetical protein
MQGDYADAERNYEKALEIAVNVVGPNGERALNWAGDLELVRDRLSGGDGPLPATPDRKALPLMEFLPE